ncbi:MAG: hypothetical protein KUG81_08795 [Gammaproteobacteria bacterium]|nr:hypothetical protein [Gammaproteobacteria bacterium]
MQSDWLSEREGVYVTQVLDELRQVPWASELLTRIDEGGGIVARNKPLLFEARLAYELSKKNLEIQYEFPAGVGDSTIEFKISDSMEWLIELVSVCESDGIKLATQISGNTFSTLLTSNNLIKRDSENSVPIEIQKQTEEAEMITAQHKIGEKVFSRGNPTKFPAPKNAIHGILIDMRGYLGLGGDRVDYRQIAYGPNGVPDDAKELIKCWEGAPIRGLFEKIDSHPARAANLLQERVHLLGFIAENEYRESEIIEKAYWLTNPFLVSSELEDKMKRTSPLWKSHA